MEFFRFLQTTAHPHPVVLFGIIPPASSRRAAAATGLGQGCSAIDISQKEEYGSMLDLFQGGARRVRDLCPSTVMS